MRQLQELVRDEALSVSVIINELVTLAMKHKKKALLVILIELWVHSLMFQHLSELEHLYQIIPFIK